MPINIEDNLLIHSKLHNLDILSSEILKTTIMKQEYMVEFNLPDVFVDEFISKIPQQRKQIEDLMTRGIVKSYSLALNYSKLWMIVSADTEFDIMKILEDLPLSNFMIPSIAPLMFHKANKTVREFSLN
jgi:hypothetical protein